MGGVGLIRGAGEENRRNMVGGGAVLKLTPAIQISGDFNQSRYRQPSLVGYFAPERVQTIDVGSYMEFETESTLVALDFGSGAERLRKHGRVSANGGRCFADTPCFRSASDLDESWALKSTPTTRKQARPLSVQLRVGSMRR